MYTEYVVGTNIDDRLYEDTICKCMLQFSDAETEQSHHHELVYRDMVCEVQPDGQINVHKLIIHSSQIIDSIERLEYEKQKQPYHAFPSSKQVHDDYYVTKLKVKPKTTCAMLVFETRDYGHGHYNRIAVQGKKYNTEIMRFIKSNMRPESTCQ